MLVLVPEDRQVPHDLEAGDATRDEDHRLLPVRGRIRVGLAHHNEDLAAFVGGADDPPRPAVDDVVAAVICAILGCPISEVLIPEPEKVSQPGAESTSRAAATGSDGPAVTPKRRDGRSLPPE